jgi:hypothetical protein
MLHILGSRTRLCDGITRREALRAGGLGMLGLSLGHLFRAEHSRAASVTKQTAGFGKSKRCILLYLYGAPSQLETFDLKPDAPSDVKSQFRPIETSARGVSICEHLPRTAKVMDRVTLIRSLTSPYNIHNVAYAISGLPKTDIPMELNPRDSRHWPCFGSVLDYLETRAGKKRTDMPIQVALPWKFSSRSEPFRRGGPYSGFLGGGYDPVWAEFHGTATDGDPYRGIEPKLSFQVAPPGSPSLTLDRLERRRSLLQQFEQAKRTIPESSGFDRHQQRALELMSSSKMGRALDVQREPRSLRERYGMTLFGQATLAARRLVENGSRLATVFWDEFKDANTAWDTHVKQETRLKDELLPGFDRAYSALIEDLELRGLLDETLVIVLSEHGRTPKLNRTPGGGREHWSGAFCALLAGGGVKRGHLVGSTDREAGFPKDQPVSPKDMLATIYHLLGIDPQTHLDDREGRPVALVPDGKVLTSAID